MGPVFSLLIGIISLMPAIIFIVIFKVLITILNRGKKKVTEDFYEDERRKVEHHYLTTKKENTEMHGLGLMSVQKIVEKYDGLMEISDTDNVFKVIVIFFVRGND